MPRPHHHIKTGEELGNKARDLYRAWRAEGLTVQQIRVVLDDLRCMADMEIDARPHPARSPMGSAAASLLES